MSREHVEFIQSQVLGWKPWPYQQGVQYKELSVDNESKATTGIFKYPKDWSEKEAYWLESEEEFFILSGELEINETRYSAGFYGYLPESYLRRKIKASKETIIIRFIDQSPIPVKYNYGDPIPQPKKEAVEGINTFDMRWDKGVHDKKLLHLDFGRKILRIDPNTKAKTFLYMVSPQTYPENWQGPMEQHPTVEEAICIAGTLAGNHGVMRNGAYFWRPPKIPHGPYGSITGCVMLIRFVGGEHINYWSKELYPFKFLPEYNPVLPDSMLDAGKDEWKFEPY